MREHTPLFALLAGITILVVGLRLQEWPELEFSDWMALLQAFGVVSGVFAAVGIAWWQRHSEHRFRRQGQILRARSIGLYIREDVDAFVDQVLDRIDDLRPAEFDFMIPKDKWEIRLNGLFLSAPSSITDRTDTLHQLGETTGWVLQHVVALTNSYNRSVKNEIGAWENSRSQEFDHHAMFERLRKPAQDVLEVAMEAQLFLGMLLSKEPKEVDEAFGE